MKSVNEIPLRQRNMFAALGLSVIESVLKDHDRRVPVSSRGEQTLATLLVGRGCSEQAALLAAHAFREVHDGSAESSPSEPSEELLSERDRLVKAIDEEVDHMLLRPGMYCGGDWHAFELLLFQTFWWRACVLGRSDDKTVDYREIGQRLLIELTGKSSGPLGFHSRLKQQDKVSHEDFYRSLVERVRAHFKPLRGNKNEQ